MKKVVTLMCGVTTLIIVILIVLTIQGRDIRQTELDNAVDSSLEKAMSMLYAEDGLAPETDEELATMFVEALTVQIDSSSNLEVDILAVDVNKGLLSVEARLIYMHPIGTKGVVTCQRTALKEQYYVEDVLGDFVATFISDGVVYKSYTFTEGQTYINPGTPPAKEGYEFKGWSLIGEDVVVDVTDYVADEDRTFVAVWGGGSDSSVTDLLPGLYDDNNVMLASWGKLVADYGLDFEKNYSATTTSEVYWHKSESSGGYIINNSSVLSKGTKLILPDSVTKIGNYAFYGINGLQYVYISSSVTSIGIVAFQGDNLSRIVVDKNNTIYDSRGNCNAVINTATDKLVLGCKTTIVPNDVKSIGSYAFYRCLGLTALDLPDGVESIGTSAFHHCNNLKSVSIPNSVINIDQYAFANCSSLEYVNIPYGETVIGACTFTGCSSLKSVTIPDSVTHISTIAFQGCSSLSTIYIPVSVVKITTYADRHIPSPFYACSSNLKIYCGASEKQDGWVETWNYYDFDKPLSVEYDITRTEYEDNYK